MISIDTLMKGIANLERQCDAAGVTIEKLPSSDLHVLPEELRAPFLLTWLRQRLEDADRAGLFSVKAPN